MNDQRNLTNDIIIPVDIISLCLLFCIDRQTLKIFHTDNKQETSITTLTKMRIYSDNICYIKNISKQLVKSTISWSIDQTKQHDGILYHASDTKVLFPAQVRLPENCHVDQTPVKRKTSCR